FGCRCCVSGQTDGRVSGCRARSGKRSVPRHRRLGPDIDNLKRRPADERAVRLLNGPGGNGTAIRNGRTYELKPGDVIVIPAGVGHWFTRIDDHIQYLMVRIDPDKVTPLKDEAASKADLVSGGD